MFEIRKARRGFASMSAEKQREIASKGAGPLMQRAPHTNGQQKKRVAPAAKADRRGRGGRGKLPSVA